MNNNQMDTNAMDLIKALQIITNAGLVVSTPDGEVKAKPRKKLTNRRAKGSGSVVYLGKGRKKPYGACVTIGYNDETGKQIQRYISYHATREEAQTSLELYNAKKQGLIKENLFNSPANDIKKTKCPTVKEIWDKVFNETIVKKSQSTIANYNSGFMNLKDIHFMKVNEVNLHILQPLFDEVMKKGASDSKLRNMKVVCNYIFNYALKYEYVEKDYSKFITFSATIQPKNDREIFTNEEIKKLIEHNTFDSKNVLVYIFTGMRPQEFIEMIKDNVHLEERYMVGGLKTENGKNRIIPIHPIIKPFIEELMNTTKGDSLIYYNNLKAGYNKYRENFYLLMEELGMKHRPYDTRHTFATIAKTSGMNDYARKKIMGHKSNDLTDDVYTHAPTVFLVEEMDKIKIEDFS